MSRSYQEAPRFAEHLPLSGPVQLTASTGFAWAKKPRPDAAKTTAMTKRSCSKVSRTNNNGSDPARTTTTATSYEVEKQEMIKQWAQVAEAFSTSEAYNNRFITEPVDVKQLKSSKKHKVKVERVEFSGPLLSQSWHVDKLLQKHEQQIRRAGRGSTKEAKGCSIERIHGMITQQKNNTIHTAEEQHNQMYLITTREKRRCCKQSKGERKPPDEQLLVRT